MAPIDWAHLWRPEQSPFETVLRSMLVYLMVHVGFRMVGRRELRRHSMPSIIVPFLIAVALRESIVRSDTSLTTAFLGFATLLALDRLAGLLSNASPVLARIIDGPVRDLVHDGNIDEAELRRAHVTREHLLAAVRERGGEDLSKVKRASLERSGKISVIFETTHEAP
jgi:uncharacterized membrane protein YcaP (DUF421 family)